MDTIVQKKVFASLPRVTRGKPVRITGDPKNGLKFLYCNANNVFIRDLKDLLEVDIYADHKSVTTVARYSPSGFYIASCDTKGMIRIWDATNPERSVKAEYQVLSGEICELSWSPDSKKIAVCGKGKEKFAHVFNMDTGTSAGEMAVHTKCINTISYRPRSPFLIVTASDDLTLNVYEGLPFKFRNSWKSHGNFVNAARFSADGQVAVSGGADGKLFKLGGENLEEKSELGAPKAHKGGIYEVCFSPDDKEILTVSGDKTAKIFNVESGAQVCEFDMTKCHRGNNWQDMLLGGLWQKDEIIVVNGWGHIISLDRERPDKHKRVIKGHMNPIMCLAVSEDKTTAFTGGLDGIVYWDIESGRSDTVSGNGHFKKGENALITDMVISGDNLYSVGYDDTLRVTLVSAHEFSGTEIKLDSRPKAIDCKCGTVVVACENHLIVFEEGGAKGKGGSVLQERNKVTWKQTATFNSVSIHPDGASVAVGFNEEVIIYSLWTLEERNKIVCKDAVSCLAYSPDGTRLAFNMGRTVKVVRAENFEKIGESLKHTARVFCVAWSPDSRMFATGALDSFMYVWPADMTSESLQSGIKAHRISYVNKLAWLNYNSIITVGHDSNIKQFEVKVPEEQCMPMQQQVKH